MLVNFPYADLKTYKKRPAVVVAPASLDSVILCQVTSRKLPGVPVIELSGTAFRQGGLPLVSYVRPDKLFTVDAMSVQHTQGKLRPEKIKEVHNAIRSLFG